MFTHTTHKAKLDDLSNPSYRYGRTEYMDTDTVVALMPSNVMKTIVESAKVEAQLRDLMISKILESPKEKREFNPSRRDS
jgi:hypothetical protein